MLNTFLIILAVLILLSIIFEKVTHLNKQNHLILWLYLLDSAVYGCW